MLWPYRALQPPIWLDRRTDGEKLVRQNIEALQSRNIRISMDGKGNWRDNVFAERLWRTIKYEEVYLKTYATVSEVKVSVANYIRFYNTHCPHSSLDKQTTDEFYYATLPALLQVA